MTIYELDDILALRDWDKISAEIERRGFRQAGDEDKWEFKPEILYDESAYRKSVLQKDDPSNKEYYGTLYTDNKVYEGFTFISLTLFVIVREHDNVSIPKRLLLFTDAPYNAEYVMEMNSPYKCEKCGAEYIKKDLIEYDDKFLCGDCLFREVDRELAEMLATLIKSKRIVQKRSNNLLYRLFGR